MKYIAVECSNENMGSLYRQEDLQSIFDDLLFLRDADENITVTLSAIEMEEEDFYKFPQSVS